MLNSLLNDPNLNTQWLPTLRSLLKDYSDYTSTQAYPGTFRYFVTQIINYHQSLMPSQEHKVVPAKELNSEAEIKRALLAALDKGLKTSRNPQKTALLTLAQSLMNNPTPEKLEIAMVQKALGSYSGLKWYANNGSTRDIVQKCINFVQHPIKSKPELSTPPPSP